MTTRQDCGTTEGKVGGLTRADVDLTCHVDALVSGIVEVTGVEEVLVLTCVGSGLVGT